MKYSSLVLVIAVLFSCLAGCGGRPSGEVIVNVGSNKITEGDLDLLMQINPRVATQIATAQGRKRILENLVEQDLLYQQAIKQGVNRDPKVKAKADLYRRVVIAQAFVDQEVEHAAKKYYEDNKDEFMKLGLSHIMIGYGEKKGSKEKHRSEEDALKKAAEIRARLEEGADFEEIAKQSSEDSLTKGRGGSLGFVSKKDRRLLAKGYGPLLEKAYEMKVGEISEPIKTSDGYHLITLTRGIEVEPLDDVQQEIQFKLQNSTRNRLLAKLKQDYKVVYVQEEKAKKEFEAEKKKFEKKAKILDEKTPPFEDEAKIAPALEAAEAAPPAAEASEKDETPEAEDEGAND